MSKVGKSHGGGHRWHDDWDKGKHKRKKVEEEEQQVKVITTYETKVVKVEPKEGIATKDGIDSAKMQKTRYETVLVEKKETVVVGKDDDDCHGRGKGKKCGHERKEAERQAELEAQQEKQRQLEAEQAAREEAAKQEAVRQEQQQIQQAAEEAKIEETNTQERITAQKIDEAKIEDLKNNLVKESHRQLDIEQNGDPTKSIRKERPKTSRRSRKQSIARAFGINLNTAQDSEVSLQSVLTQLRERKQQNDWRNR